MKHLIAALAFFLFSTTALATPANFTYGGNATSINWTALPYHNLVVGGHGTWTMNSKGKEYDTHYVINNTTAQTRYVTYLWFDWSFNNQGTGATGFCNINKTASYSGGVFDGPCIGIICVSNTAGENLCLEMAEDGGDRGLGPNKLGFTDYDGMAIPANGSMSVDIHWQPQGSGSISPARTSIAETVQFGWYPQS